MKPNRSHKTHICTLNIPLLAIFLILSSGAFSTSYNVIDYGARADGTTLNTQAIQAAIDAAAKAGGGRVEVPEGTFLTGSIVLKENVELYLAKKAVLLGSLNFFDYQKTDRWYALILAKDAKSISVTGKGTIDGQGGQLAQQIDDLIKTGSLKDPNYNHDRKRPNEKVRPQLIEFLNCRHVTIQNITLKNAACWVQTYDNCRDMVIDGIRVESTAFWNNDGLDLSDCKNVVVKNSFIDSADDGICLKSHKAELACENIRIEHCTLRSSASAIKFGTASYGNFRNIRIKNIEVYDTYRSVVALETVDGGIIENVEISNINAKNTGNAIFLRIGQRNEKTEPGFLRNIRISNMKIEVPNAVPDAGYPMAGPPVRKPHNLIASSIVGLPDRKIENIMLQNIEIIFGGGAAKEVACIPLDRLDQIPQCRSDYPEFSMFGELPATGLFVRHAEGLAMKNITIQVKEPDFRPAFVFDDVQSLQLKKIKVPNDPNEQIILNNTNHVLLDKKIVRLSKKL